MGGPGGIFQELISPTKYPKVPAAAYVSPQQAQMQSIQGNITALPQLEQLGSSVDKYYLGERRGMLDTSIPGFEGMLGAGSQNMTDWLHGVIGQDTADAVSRNANARAFAGGYAGSPASANLQARDLGLTSLQLQQGATQALPSYLGGLAGILMPQQFDVTRGMVTPAQQIAGEQWNEMNRYQREAIQNEIDALPDPLMQALGTAVGQEANFFDSTVKSMLSKYLGSSGSMSYGSGAPGGGGGGFMSGGGGGWSGGGIESGPGGAIGGFGGV